MSDGSERYVSQESCIIYAVMNGLTPAMLVYQIEAFASYRDRGGPLSLEEWMGIKDFSIRERATLRAIWARESRETS